MKFIKSLIVIVLFCQTGATFSQNEGRWYSVELIIFKRLGSAAYTREIWPNDIELNYPSHYQYLKESSPPVETQKPEQKDVNLVDSVTQLDAKPDAESFALIPKDQWLLQPYRNALQRRDAYRVLFHKAWTQQMFSEDDSPAIIVSGGEAIGEHTELSGYIKLHIARYLHLRSDLWLITDDDPIIPKLKPSIDKEDDGYPNQVAESKEWLNHWPIIPKQPLPQFRPESPDTQALNTKPRAIEGPWDFASLEGKPSYPLSTLRDSRKMRSTELHYLDHPLMGLIILITPLS